MSRKLKICLWQKWAASTTTQQHESLLMKLDIIGMADIKEQEEARVNLKERLTMTLSLSQWTKEPLWEKGTKGIYRQHNDKILQMPACTEQKNIRYHQTKTNPSPKCGFLDKIMETWGIHINGHLNAKTLFDLNLEDLSSRSCSCTPLYPLYTSSVLKEYSTDFTL